MLQVYFNAYLWCAFLFFMIMKTLILTTLSFFVHIQCASSQIVDNIKPFIEITGTNEMEVTPDQLFVTITLQERMDGKEKISITKQENDLKQNIKELGIDLSNLTLNSADADYTKVRKSAKDVLINKSYILKISGTDQLSKVYERLDRINVLDAFISKYDHSKIIELQKENQIKALKIAKEKIDYLLDALGQKAKSPIEIREIENYVQNATVYGRNRNLASNAMQVYGGEGIMQDSNSEIAFKKIKIKSSFLVKYEIINK